MKFKFVTRSATKNLSDFCGLRIWQKPKEGTIYAMGADVAEGVGGDASCATILDCGTGLHVASYWHNHIDTDNYAADLYKMGHWYNKAFLCIEANNHGHAVIAHLSGSVGGLAYPNLYKRMRYNEFIQKREKVIGFQTNAQTKPHLIENLKSAFKMGDITTHDRYLMQEMSSFVRDEKTGKIGAKGNAHDDRVISMALAWEQARILREGMKMSSEASMPKMNYDPQTGFLIGDSYEVEENLF